MKYVDYVFDLDPDVIMFDEELTLDRLKMRLGDYWQVCQSPQGQVILRKVDPVVAFTNGFSVNTNTQ